MTTLNPREPYSPEELERLYPKNLKLELVQVVSHGIRNLSGGAAVANYYIPAVLASWYGLNQACRTGV